MDRSHDPKAALTRDEQHLVERLRAEWTPTPLTAFERTRFDATLQERLTHAQRRVGRWPALVAGLTAAAVATLLIVRIGLGPAPPTPTAGVTDPSVPASWAADVLFATVTDAMTRDPEPALPNEYAAIASVLLEL